VRALALVIAAPLLAAGVGRGEEMTFEAVADTCISEGEPDANYGSSVQLRISAHDDPSGGEWGWGIRRGLIRFDLSAMAGEVTILGARFEGYQTNTAYVGDGLNLYRAAEGWAEDSVTWNTQPAVGDPLGRMALATDRYCSFASEALSQAVRYWLAHPEDNYGLALRFHDEWVVTGQTGLMGDTLRSRESSAGTPPRLIVEYDPTPPLMGDANFDGEVGIADLSAVADHYGTLSGATWEMGDFNIDGQVGIADLTALADHYGDRKDAPVPESTTVILLGVGAAIVVRRCRRFARSYR